MGETNPSCHPELVSAGHPELVSAGHPELVSGSTTDTTAGQRLKPQIARQVTPVWIGGFDKIDLPLTTPVLELLLARNGQFHCAGQLKIDQPRNAMTLRKAFNCMVSMLVNALDKIACNARVERAAIAASHNIGARIEVALHRTASARRWTLKQVQGDGSTELEVCKQNKE